MDSDQFWEDMGNMIEYVSASDALDSETGLENSESDEELPIWNIWHGKDNVKWSKTVAIRCRATVYNLVKVSPGLAGLVRNNPPNRSVDDWCLLFESNHVAIHSREQQWDRKTYFLDQNEFGTIFISIELPQIS